MFLQWWERHTEANENVQDLLEPRFWTGHFYFYAISQAKSQGGEEMHSTHGNSMNLGKVKIWGQQFIYSLGILHYGNSWKPQKTYVGNVKVLILDYEVKDNYLKSLEFLSTSSTFSAHQYTLSVLFQIPHRPGICIFIYPVDKQGDEIGHKESCFFICTTSFVLYL